MLTSTLGVSRLRGTNLGSGGLLGVPLFLDTRVQHPICRGHGFLVSTPHGALFRPWMQGRGCLECPLVAPEDLQSYFLLNCIHWGEGFRFRV